MSKYATGPTIKQPSRIRACRVLAWHNHLLVLFLVIGMFIGLLTTAHAAETAIEARVSQLGEELAQSASAGDLEGIAEVRAALETLAGEVEPNQGIHTYITYFQAVADFRTGAIDRAGGKAELDRCLDRMGDLLARESDFVEGYVLEAACAGNLISSAPERVMDLSMRARRALQLAKEIEPENPRAAFVEGLSILFTPQNFGGGPKVALSRFEEAVRYFEQDGNNSGLIRWGHDEALMWLGITLSMDDRPEEALEALREAAKLGPEAKWIGTVLIPRVEAGKSLGGIFGFK